MSLAKTPNRMTRKKVQGFTLGVKDMVCDIYEYIQRWANNEEYKGTPPSFDTIEGVRIGIRGTKYYDSCWNDTFVGRFFHNLDHIKELVEQRPEVKVVYYTHVDPNPDKLTPLSGQYSTIHEYRTFREWDESELRYLLGIVNRPRKYIVLSEKNVKKSYK